MSKMARVMDYEGGKKFIRDAKMGRRWEVTKRRVMKRTEGEKEEGKPKSIGAPSEKKKKRFRPGTMAL